MFSITRSTLSQSYQRGTLKDTLEQDYGATIEDGEDLKDTPTIEVKNQRVFFDTLEPVRAFGLKSAIALIALANLQKQRKLSQ